MEAAAHTNGTWERLARGNARFAQGTPDHPHASPQRRASLLRAQHPVAAVLGCADSRVPPELVLDCGLGDLFTVRSAGATLDSMVIGTLEYAVEHLGVGLIVVLGHTSCGAVQAAIQETRGHGHTDGHLGTLVRSIEPAVHATPAEPDDAAFLAACVAAQARRSAQALPSRSTSLYKAVNGGQLTILPAVYDLSTGLAEPLS